MATISKHILHITPFFYPNIGGVEAHLIDLIGKLDSLGYQNTVLTYSPITNPNTSYKNRQKLYKNSYVRRFSWLGNNLFHHLEKYPIINFLYIAPYLLLRSVFWILLHHKHIDTIHSHGINAALIGNIVSSIFNIKHHVVSIYSTYDNVPTNPNINQRISNILNKTNSVLVQSGQSLKQLKKMGVNNLSLYRHWIDTSQFSPTATTVGRFTVLFVGRMIPQKGAYLLAKTAKDLPLVKYIFVGTGPDYKKIKKIKSKNIKLIGNVDYSKLHNYYKKASVLCVPSIYKEGWGRVAMEALSSGIPIISSNKGGLTELLNSSIATIISPTIKNLKLAIQELSKNKHKYDKLQKKCRPYALKHFSSQNVRLITKVY